MLVNFTFSANIDAAKMGSVAFFEPDIDIVPKSSFLPFIKSFCIKET